MEVKQALVPASLLTSVLDGSLLAVDVRPLVVHVLLGLQAAGVERAVVVLGNGAEQIRDSITQEQFPSLRIEFLWGISMEWGSSLANNIMAARTAFEGDRPLLIVRSDYLFDWELLHQMARVRFDSKTEAFALIDSAQETLEWVSGAHCKAYCQNGHCNALVKVLRGTGDRIARIGHRLTAYDALQAGIYVARPSLFLELGRLLKSRQYCTVADSMQALAEAGRLRFVDTGEFSCNKSWFGHEIMQTALVATASGVPSKASLAQAEACSAAMALLHRPRTAGKPESPALRSRGDSSDARDVVPLYNLGNAIGSGTNGVVHDATGRVRSRVPTGSGLSHRGGPASPKHESSAGGKCDSQPPHALPRQYAPASSRLWPQSAAHYAADDKKDDDGPQRAMPRSNSAQRLHGKAGDGSSPETQRNGGGGGAEQNLAVKVVRKGQTNVQKVMWEIHVLRQLAATAHPHIVKLLDVIDVVDSCYMIMERVDGPDLSRWIREQPGGVLPSAVARRIFAQLLAALRHAHRAGFVHCDVKPENVRLLAADGAEHAVLLDWGYARRIGLQSEPITQGTPAYAAPEQLTGFQSDGVSARATLSANVDVWGLGATLCEMLSGAPPFGGLDFEQLVQNVLMLNFCAAMGMIDGEPRAILENMLQIHPSDRMSVDELCAHPWVAESGALPESTYDVVALELTCDDCEAPPKSGLRGMCDAYASPNMASTRRQLLYLVYAILCIGALLHWQMGGGEAVHFELQVDTS